MPAKGLQTFLPLVAVPLMVVNAQLTDQTLFAAWNSTNKGYTQWYLPVKTPHSGIADLHDWGVQRSRVPHGWTPRDPSKLTGDYTTVGFLQVDSTGAYESNTNFNDTSVGVDVFQEPYVWSSAVSYAADTNSSEALWLPAGASFTLGPKANFTTSQLLDMKGSQEIQNTTWSSVPFGLSLGFMGANGSVVFGGSYDWARVNDSQWHQLPMDLGQCILHIGGEQQGPNGPLSTTCNVDNQAAKIGGSSTTIAQSIYLDWLSHEIVLPGNAEQAGGANCQNTIEVTLAGARIDMNLGKLLGPGDLGVSCESTGNNFTLGLPFLQQLYLYADHDGSVYVARGLASNGTISPRPFDPNATIEQHPEAKYDASKSSGVSTCGAPVLLWSIFSILLGWQLL